MATTPETSADAGDAVQNRDVPAWGTRGSAAVSFAASLAFESISHSYDGRRVLSDVSFDVAPGELVCLLGPSGCGKSTLLRIAAGIERQDAGTVLLNGSNIAGDRVFVPPEKRQIGLVFQDFALFPHLTISQNVAFGLRRVGRREVATATRRALDRVGLSTYGDKYPHMLSGGEQQRVALARAIAPRPAILLMDEPFSGLDKRLRDRVRAETLAVLAETRTTAIFVTHDPEEAMRVGNRIALLRAGRLIQIGTPDQLYRAPADFAAARFFSEINELEGVVAGDRVSTPVGDIPANGLAEGETVVVCVRPQAVRLDRAGAAGASGRVLARQFVGEMDAIEVAVSGVEQPLLARIPAGHAAPGEDVSVTLDIEHVMVFARPRS